MKITARTLSIEYARRKFIHYEHSLPKYTTREIVEACFFAGYKTAEKEWRKKLKEAERAALEGGK